MDKYERYFTAPQRGLGIKDPGRADIVEELFRPTRRRFPRRRVVLRGLSDLVQADLAEFQTLSRDNGGNRYLLVIINCFSKKAFAMPIKNKTSETVASAMEKLLDKAKTPFKLCQTDDGSEFKGDFARLLKNRNIHHYKTYTGIKASIVERLIRTLKHAIYKRMALTGSNRYIDFLDEILSDYNKRIHSTTKLAPNKVTKKHEKLLLETVYNYNRPRVKPKFKVDDVVRVSKTKFVFSKGYHPSWSTQLYRIKHINNKKPVTYTLTNHSRTADIDGSFYQEELQKTKNDDVFLVEKIVGRRGKFVRVRYTDYPPEDDTWELASSIYDVKKTKKRRKRRS